MSVIFFQLILYGLLILPSSLGDDESNLNNSKPKIVPVHKFKVFFLEANSPFNFTPSKVGFFEKHLNTYCYRGEPKTLGRLLETIELQLEIEGNDYIQYEGKTPTDVEEHYSEHRSIFRFNFFSPKRSRLLLSPFVQQCIGIETVKAYNVTLHREKIDFYRSVQLLSGIIIFLFAGVLSTNSLFYYIAGVFFGICSSFLLLIWLSGKLMPKRTMMYGVVIGGWTVGFYMIRMLWNNIQVIMITYRTYVCWYIIITGIASFLICYRWGPPRNRRSKNIIKWLLQVAASVIIYFSSNFKEASLAIVLMTVILYYFPRVLKKNMSLPATTLKDFFNHKKYSNNGSRAKKVKDDCQQWRINKTQHNDRKMKQKARPLLTINTELEQRLTPTEQLDAKCQMNNLRYDHYIDDYDSESVANSVEQDLAKNLYPLPDGTFLFSEKPPIILTPRRVAPVYHGSTPGFLIGAQNEEDYTPKKQYSQMPSRYLNAAASTSDLLSIDRRSSALTQIQLQRSNSIQRIQSRMMTPGQKYYDSNPRTSNKNSSSDNEI